MGGQRMRFVLACAILTLGARAAPSISYFEPWNSPTSGSASITVLGENFGTTDPTPTVLIGLVGAADTQRCQTTSWVSSSLLMCAATHDAGVGRAVRAIVAGETATATNNFSYDPPHVSKVRATNRATTGGSVSVTIHGVNFGDFDFTLASRIGDTACGTASWHTATSVLCYIDSMGDGVSLPVAVTVREKVGCLVGSFTFDDPIVSFAWPHNVASSGSISITLSGTNFGAVSLTPTASIGALSCLTTSWTSQTNLKCLTRPGVVGSMLDLTVSQAGLRGTGTNLFSFDAPVVTQTFERSFTGRWDNGATTGGKTLTISGTNFGLLNLTPSVRVGKTVCRTVGWSSLTTLKCQLPPGYASAQQITAELGRLSGTLRRAFSYDAPVVSLLAVVNAPGTSGSVLTVLGTNFGFEDTTPLPRIGVTRCATASWNSETQLLCRLDNGGGPRNSVALTIGMQVGTVTTQFTYDAPVVTSSGNPNSPVSGSAPLTLYGTNFVPTDASLTALVSPSTCGTTSWSSASSIRCLVPVGYGAGSYVSADVLTIVGTAVGIFTYDSPLISFVRLANGAASSQTSITLIGSNFVALDATPTAAIGFSLCLTTSWTSTTQIKCRLSPGLAGGSSVALTMAALVATSFKSFSFDSPALTFVQSPNLPSTTAYSLTINGFNFGVEDATPTLFFGPAMCASSSWTAVTALICLPATTFEGAAITTRLQLAGVMGTGLAMFSYDSPVLSVTRPSNAPSTAGSTITVGGSNFGSADRSLSASIGGALCQTSGFISSTSVRCLIPAGAGSALEATLTLAAGIGTQRSAFTYDAPIVTSVMPRNAPASSAGILTALGFNFGTSDLTPTVLIGVSTCGTTSWTSATLLHCASSSGTGLAAAVSAVVNSVAGTMYAAFSYDAPTISSASLYNAPASASISITVLGSNFGVTDATTTLLLGSSACTTTSWTTMTSLSCHLSRGTGVEISSVAIVEANAGTTSVRFTYDAPVGSALSLSNSAQTYGVSVTVAGFNFGTIDRTPIVQLGSTLTQTAAWVSDTQMVVLPSTGVGVAQPFGVLLSQSVATMAAAYSYDAPTVSHLQVLNSPASGGAQVTVHGHNLGLVDPTATVRVGSTPCLPALWTSVTALRCSVGKGVGIGHSLLVDIARAAGTSAPMFTYDAPVVTTTKMKNAATSGGIVVTFQGVNFASYNQVEAKVGNTACVTSVWVTGTAVTCVVPKGVGQVPLVIAAGLAVEGQIGTFVGGFSYDAPVLTHLLIANGPSTGGATTTVMGTNFGWEPSGGGTSTPLLISTSIAGEPSLTASWTSSTSLAFTQSPGTSAAATVAVTLSDIVGSRVSAFSFDAPLLSFVDLQNLPALGGADISIAGTGFGQLDNTPTVQLGMTSCATSSWTSATQVLCQSAAAAGADARLSITVDRIVGSATEIVTYDSPVVSHSYIRNGPTSGSTKITVLGTNLRPNHVTKVGIVDCAAGMFVSSTSLVCTTPTSAGSDQSILVSSGTIKGSPLPSQFTYDAPSVTVTSLGNGATTGSGTVTMFGINFGTMAYSQTATLGTSACRTTNWVSDSLVRCVPRAGVSAALPATVEVSAIRGTAMFAFSYDSPAVSAMLVANGPASGAATVTIVGFNMGTQYGGVTALLGATPCFGALWLSSTSIRCTSPAGTGKLLAATVSVASTPGVSPTLFSFDAPVASFANVGMPNIPATASRSITLAGFGFGGVDPTPTIVLDSLRCATSSWFASTMLRCLPTGAASAAMPAAIVDALIGTALPFFSFDAPIITNLVLVNSPSFMTSTVSVFGTNFGAVNLTPSVRIANRNTFTSAWVSTTSVSAVVLGPQLGEAVRIWVPGSTAEFEAQIVPVPTPVPTTGSPVAGTGSPVVSSTGSPSLRFGPCVWETDRLRSSTGVLSSGSSAYQSNAYCGWTIDVQGATSISLNFDAFDVETGYDYLRVYEGTTTQKALSTFTGTDIPQPVTYQGSQLHLIFVSDTSIQGTGFLIRYEALFPATPSPGTPTPVQLNEITTAPVVPVVLTPFPSIAPSGAPDTPAPTPPTPVPTFSPTTAYPSFYPTAMPSAVPTLSPTLLPTSVSQLNTLTPSLGPTSVPTLMPTLAPTVMPTTAAPTTPLPTAVPMTPAPTTLTPSLPTTMPVTSTPVTAAPTSMTPVPSSTSSPALTPTSGAPSSTPSTASPTAPPSLSPGAPCSGTKVITSTSGILSSGSTNYLPNMLCTWQISVAEPNVRFEFEYFSLEQGYDFVEVFQSGSQLESFSGGVVPSSFVASSNSLRVVFRSDGSVESSGFSMRYTATASMETVAPTVLLTSPPTASPSDVPTLLPTSSAALNTLTPTLAPTLVPTVMPTTVPSLGTSPPTTNRCSGSAQLTSSQGHFSDGSGPYPSNADCQWTVVAEEGKNIRLSFSAFDLEGGYDFVRVYDGSVLVSTLSGASPPGPIVSYSSVMRVTFTSDATVQGAGFNASYITGVFDTTPAPMLTQAPVSFSDITTAPANAVGDDRCSGLQDLYSSSGTITDGDGPAIPGVSAPSEYRPNTQCEWIIHARSGSASLVSLTFTSLALEQGYDFIRVYDGSMLMASISGNMVPSETFQSYGRLRLVLTTDGSVQEAGFTASFNVTSVSTTPTPAVLEPILTPTPTALQRCSGTVEVAAASGVISDGSDIYNPNAQCAWMISITAGQQIMLSFEAFSLEQGYDFLYLYAGATLLASYSGSLLPPPRPVYSSLRLVFTSDSSVQGDGFVARYNISSALPTASPTAVPSAATAAPVLPPTTVPTMTPTSPSAFSTLSPSVSPTQAPTGTPSDRCWGSAVLTAPSGSLTDGVGPYPPNSRCEWVITAAAGSSISLSFSSFALEQGYDFVRVYDANRLMASYSGFAIPADLRSSSSTMRVLFGADSSEERDGFEASYSIIPGTPAPTVAPGTVISSAPVVSPVFCTGSTQLVESSGTISDGSGPYSANANCEWTIIADQGKRIVLTFDMFALEAGYDFVRVYDGTTLVVSLTGSTLPFPVTSSSSSVTVKFNSDSSVQNSGFVAQYTVYSASEASPTTGYTSSPVALASLDRCDGVVTYTAAEGVITDGSGPYSGNAKCEFLILTQSDRRIRLTFALFALEQGYDFLELYDDGSVIRLSGPSLPAPFVSSGPQLRVVFTSDNSVHADGFVARYTITNPITSAVGPTTTSQAFGNVQILSHEGDDTEAAASALLSADAGAEQGSRSLSKTEKDMQPFMIAGALLAVAALVTAIAVMWHRRKHSARHDEVHPCSDMDLAPAQEQDTAPQVRMAWGEDQEAFLFGEETAISMVQGPPEMSDPGSPMRPRDTRKRTAQGWCTPPESDSDGEHLDFVTRRADSRTLEQLPTSLD